jgi:hypothetical protein
MEVRAVLGTGWTHRPSLASADFPQTGWGQRGYDPATVDSFVQRAGDELAAAQRQHEDLRLEVDRLHRYIRRQWAAVAAAESADGARQDGVLHVASPAAQARAVLNQAQEIAERRLAEASDRLCEAERIAAARLERADREVADRLAGADELVKRRIREADLTAAERLDRVDAVAGEVMRDARRAAEKKRSQACADAQRLLTMARTRYEEIVIRAHQRADQAAELALHSFEEAASEAQDAGRARAELEMKAAYLRTFAKVSRTALQAALDISGREFDRLVEASAATEPQRPMIARPADFGPGRSAEPAPKARLIVLPGTSEAIDVARVSR